MTSLAALFATNAPAAALRVLRAAKAPLTAVEVKKALRDAGIPQSDVDKAWPGVRRSLKVHDQVVVDGARYRWTTRARALSAPEALEFLLTGQLSAAKRAALLAIIRSGLMLDPETAARRRQSDIDAVRSLAELAIEVEELTANHASADAMIHRIRSRVRRTGLEPIDRAGEATTFDRRRHQPIGRPIGDGAPVVVVRPGYTWMSVAKSVPESVTEEILISKAVVEE